MKKYSLVFFILCFSIVKATAQQTISQWNHTEINFHHVTSKNPFTDIELSAVFIHEGLPDTIHVDGFYDDNNTFRIRFMPTLQGKWDYITHSSEAEMDNKKGYVICTTPQLSHHGMVKAGTQQNFVYTDGTPFYPLGTTSYAWIYSAESRQKETLYSLRKAGFNKLRFCIFPNNSVRELPQSYPYLLLSKDKKATCQYTWDFSRFNSDFFHHLEQCIDSLKNIGVEADIILFTPYDEGLWGFDRMSMENNMRYLHYVVARLSGFSNVWWSMANEWNLIKSKTYSQWIEMTKYVYEQDPYRHLLSIHGGTAKYIDYNLPYFTHASIQDQGPLYNIEGAATVRNIIHKPILFDEVCYEGNHKARWAQLTGEQMLQRIWTGLMGGTYVTHGECFCTGKDYYTGYSFLATGGSFKGTSAQRIKFTLGILKSLPNPLRLADESWDPMTASAGPNTYFIYFGSEQPKKWKFELPAKNDVWPRLQGNEKFKVDIIDTWNMTVKHYPVIFRVKAKAAKRMVDKDERMVVLPGKTNILLKITRL
jgi:hypothetical protein